MKAFTSTVTLLCALTLTVSSSLADTDKATEKANKGEKSTIVQKAMSQGKPNATQSELDSLQEMKPIKGIHPIKRAFRPLEELQLKVVALQERVAELQKPISELHPAMVTLQSDSASVDKNLGAMQEKLNNMRRRIDGVRADLASMQVTIAKLRPPIVALKGPMEEVARPMLAVRSELNWIIAAIVAAALGIAVGTPLLGFLIYMNRNRLFPVRYQTQHE